MVYQFVLLQRLRPCTAAELLAYHYMNHQRREPIAQTHEQQSYIDERIIDTEPLPVPAVELSQEQIAADNRAKQERTEAQKERDELKETLKKMLQMQKESLTEIEKLKKDKSEPSSSSTFDRNAKYQSRQKSLICPVMKSLCKMKHQQKNYGRKNVHQPRTSC